MWGQGPYGHDENELARQRAAIAAQLQNLGSQTNIDPSFYSNINMANPYDGNAHNRTGHQPALFPSPPPGNAPVAPSSLYLNPLQQQHLQQQMQAEQALRLQGQSNFLQQVSVLPTAQMSLPYASTQVSNLNVNAVQSDFKNATIGHDKKDKNSDHGKKDENQKRKSSNDKESMSQKNDISDSLNDNNNIQSTETAIQHSPLVKSSSKTTPTSEMTATADAVDVDEESHHDNIIVPVQPPPRGKTFPSTMTQEDDTEAKDKQTPESPSKPKEKGSTKKKKTKIKKEDNATSTPSKKKKTPSKSSSAKKTPQSKTPSTGTPNTPITFSSTLVQSLIESVPPITPQEYQNLDQLMNIFCRVPLLAEFSRPVSLLHPELIPVYSRVVSHPIDLGRVCRAIRRRSYNDTRTACIDMWRIFANCIKYHTHPLTREGAIPSFVSIAMHLRDFFNELWREYMIPSDIQQDYMHAVGTKKSKPTKAEITFLENIHDKREQARKERLINIDATELSKKAMNSTAAAIDYFLSSNGCVDVIDTEPIFNIADHEYTTEDLSAIAACISALKAMSSRLKEVAQTDDEYTVETMTKEIKRCYSHDIFEGSTASLRSKVSKRLDRLLGKITVPIYEANCRGVNQSSIWGQMAALIWARESTKRPYWPALVLGILAPDDQKEVWHKSLTERNENRLPEKLRQELLNGKRKAEQAISKQTAGQTERMSFFLVEFLGSHEFIWVKETDIIENFDPKIDPNQQAVAGNASKKKKLNLRNQTPANARIFQKAYEEGTWALDEFEMQLNDPCGDLSDDEEEENYSFEVLCESDDEADEADGGLTVPNDNEEASPTSSELFSSPLGKYADIDEINELLATDGLLDYSTEGRKIAKRRAAAFKKLQADAKKAALQKDREAKAKAAKKAKEEKEKQQESAKKKAPGSSTKPKLSKESEKIKRQNDFDIKREQKELEKRRKKRERERERVLKEEERKAKKMKSDTGSQGIIRKGRKLNIADKRGRAATVVCGYLNRIAKKEDLKGLGLNGVLTIPAANIESSGLLGLTLAFRAAAGEIPMPNSNDNPSGFKPWDRIDADSHISSAERCKKLESQIELLQQALIKLDRDDVERQRLIAEAISEKEAKDIIIQNAEKKARKNEMPVRKSLGKKKDEISPKDEDNDDPTNTSIGDPVTPSDTVMQEVGDDSSMKDGAGSSLED